MKTVAVWDDRALTFRRGDLICIFLVAATALILAVFLALRALGVETTVLQVRQDGVLLKEYSLKNDQVFSVDGDYRNTVTIRAGKVAITHSDCPGSDCVHSGWIDRAGTSIVCLPNRLELRITGENTVDMVVH